MPAKKTDKTDTLVVNSVLGHVILSPSNKQTKNQ